MVIDSIALAILVGSPEAAFNQLQIPVDFTKQLIAVEPKVMDPVAFCFDDKGNILVAESFRQEQGVEDNRSSAFWLNWDLSLQTVEDRLHMYEHFADQRANGMAYYSEFEDRIRLLQDIDGDGVYETASIYADGFNHPLDGTGAGVFAMGDEVWYTNIPNLWRLKDTNNDGIADVKESLFTGFGVRTALRGHDMHGLALGLDGRMYWSIGDRGYHIELQNGTELHSSAEGAVFRCNLDGTEIEMFHHGLRNPQELAFDNFGNLFTCDNNSDAVDKARLVYCVEGGETGWRMEYQTLEGENQRGPWVQEHGWDPHAIDRPAWILPAIDVIGSGPSGFVAYPGGGLSERYDDHFFMCDFRGDSEHSSVLSFAVEPKGAHFSMVDLHPFVEKVLCTDVDFDYNGKLVISDWGAGWTGNYEGRLYAVWDESHVDEGDVSEIFAEGFDIKTTTVLIALLFHNDRRVRIRAQFELANRNASSELAAVLQSHSQLARLHAMWGLAMIDRIGEKQMHYIVPLLQAKDLQVRAHACRILGEAKHTKSFAQIVSLIDDTSARVSYFATIASSHLGNAFDAILAMLERNDNEDVYLRHAGVVALSKTQYQSALANLQTHPSDAVRLAAVLALRKQESSFVADFLHDKNSDIATEAARAIHDAPVLRTNTKAMARLEDTLSIATTVPWQRRAISANKIAHSWESSIRVANFANDGSKPDAMRVLAIQALRNWVPKSFPDLERDLVEGRRVIRVHHKAICYGEIQLQIEEIIETAKGELLTESLALAQLLLFQLPSELNQKFLHDESINISARVFCLHNLTDSASLDFAIQSDRWELRAAAADMKLTHGDADAVQLLLHAVKSSGIQEAQAAIKSLARNSEWFALIDSKILPPELQLDYAEHSGRELKFDHQLGDLWLIRGGNTQRGMRIIFENSQTQCLRCHSIDGVGGIAAPSLDGVASRVSERGLLESLLRPSAEIVEGYGAYSAMPPIGVFLGPRDVRDVVAYLKSLHE